MLAAICAISGDALAQKKKKRSSAPAAPSIAAAIVVDMNAGSILHTQSADTRRYPASLTKIMTLYVLFGYLKAGKLSYDTDLVVTQHAASQARTKLGLKPGSTIKTSDAIKALVTHSANDAAAVIAENIAGTEENFGRLMTQTARNMGMKNSTFRNASGLPNPDQVTTARDMAILAVRIIRDYPDYYGVFETRAFSFRGRSYRNHNKLLYGYKGTDGIKTGYTRASGFNLTASVKRDNKHLVAVVLGGKTAAQRDAAMRALLDKNLPKASAPKPQSRSLIATLMDGPAKKPAFALAEPTTPPAPPPVKKPAYALAEASPAPSLPAPTKAAAKPLVKQASLPMEGYAEPEAEIIQASLTPEPAPQRRAKRKGVDGAFQVQVGAYMNQSDAENRLGMVQQRAPDLLEGHLPFTQSFLREEREWYRARFAGFSEEKARNTCAALKQRSLDCVVMRAE
jgi:D-alanyl-D-alanine carboxypeptidase